MKSVTVENNARRLLLGRWIIFETWISEVRELTLINRTEIWYRTSERMMLNFAESGHPIFRATSALERGE